MFSCWAWIRHNNANAIFLATVNIVGSWGLQSSFYQYINVQFLVYEIEYTTRIGFYVYIYGSSVFMYTQIPGFSYMISYLTGFFWHFVGQTIILNGKCPMSVLRLIFNTSWQYSRTEVNTQWSLWQCQLSTVLCSTLFAQVVAERR